MSGSPYSIKIDEYRPELDPGPSTPASASAVRKSDRACDFCRRRKTRCDGAPNLSTKCSNCRKNQCPCTYLEASRPRGPPKAYVTALEDRIERFERLFKRLRPDTDFTEILGPPIPRGSWKSDQERYPGSHNRQASDASSKTGHSAPSSSICLPSLLPRKAAEGQHDSDSAEDSYSSEEDFLDVDDWPRRRLTVRGAPTFSASSDAESPVGTGSVDSPLNEAFSTSTGSFARTGFKLEDGSSIRFLGKSSLFPLVKATRQYMRDTAGDDGFHEPGQGSDEIWSDAGRIGISNIPRRRRERFWIIPPWEEAWERKQSYFVPDTSSSSKDSTPAIFDFPPSDLTLPLLSLYFHHTNVIFPLLHAPTFYAQFRDILHLRDAQFAGVVWAVMAVASRWSDDRRVLWEGWGSEKNNDVPKVEEAAEELEWASAGWRFFLRSLDGTSLTITSLDPPSLFDLQFASLGAMFLRGTSVGPVGWILIGTGLRKAMDVGAHRKKVYGPELSLENELWKRAFWMLVLFDRLGSASLGRPTCVRDEDFDIDSPLEVDDEYWIPSDPSQPAFKQPEGKPSIVSGFICMLKISQIMAHALRTIYCIDKSKVLLGLVSDDWQAQIVSQLNAALDEWVESVPEHLRWSASIENDIFSNQSASIYATYYLALTLIYRPFSQASALIPSPNQDASTRPVKNFPFPADSICTSAARSAIRIIDEQTRRGMSNIPVLIVVAHLAAVTLLMDLQASQLSGAGTGVGGTRKADLAVREKERKRYVEDVEKCIKYLEMCESRWIMARKFLTSIKSALPEPGSSMGFAPPGRGQKMDLNGSMERRPSQAGLAPPTVPSQPWSTKSGSTRPTSRTNDVEQALKSHANWRWFHENEKFAQQRFASGINGVGASMQRADMIALRHHVVVPSTSRSSESPTPMPIMTPNIQPVMPLPAHSPLNGFPTRSDVGRRVSVHSTSPPPRPLLVPDPPISSISRAVRASTSGQFLSVVAPQSAAREELGAGSWSANVTSRQYPQQQQQQATMRVPSHPYATLHQTLQHNPQNR
ncbi:hypothetical protein ACEPAI_8138 [Sanghuangporus weigelae]